MLFFYKFQLRFWETHYEGNMCIIHVLRSESAWFCIHERNFWLSSRGGVRYVFVLYFFVSLEEENGGKRVLQVIVWKLRGLKDCFCIYLLVVICCNLLLVVY